MTKVIAGAASGLVAPMLHDSVGRGLEAEFHPVNLGKEQCSADSAMALLPRHMNCFLAKS